jgi:hypothetical protein
MTHGSCENLHSVSLRLRSLKVDVHLNEKRIQDVSGFYLPACIKHNKYLEALRLLHVDALTGCTFKSMRIFRECEYNTR